MEISNQVGETFMNYEFRADDLYNQFDLLTLKTMVAVSDKVIESLKVVLGTMNLRNANDKYQQSLLVEKLDNVVNNRTIINASIKFYSMRLPIFCLN